MKTGSDISDFIEDFNEGDLSILFPTSSNGGGESVQGKRNIDCITNDSGNGTENKKKMKNDNTVSTNTVNTNKNEEIDSTNLSKIDKEENVENNERKKLYEEISDDESEILNSVLGSDEVMKWAKLN